MDLSGQWLWALQGKYAHVLESNDEVPHQVNTQGVYECHILFVSTVHQLSVAIYLN